MKKADRKKLEERTTYKVYKAFTHLNNVFAVHQFLDDDPENLYHVTLIWPDIPKPLTPKVVHCDCPGFRLQKFAHMDHKHVKLVLDYQERGEPRWARYRIHGTGAHTKIEFLNADYGDQKND